MLIIPVHYCYHPCFSKENSLILKRPYLDAEDFVHNNCNSVSNTFLKIRNVPCSNRRRENQFNTTIKIKITKSYSEKALLYDFVECQLPNTCKVNTLFLQPYVSVLSSIEQKYIHLVTFGSNKPTEEGLIYLWCDPVLGMLSMCANYGLDDLTQRCWFSQLQKYRAISASYPAFIDKPNCFVV